MKLKGLLKVWTGILFFILTQQGMAQQLKLGTNPTQLDKDAVLDLNSDNQGLLLPRILKSQIMPGGSLWGAANGMFVYVTDESSLYLKKGAWEKVADFANLTPDVTGGVSYDTLQTNDIREADAPDAANRMKVWSPPAAGAVTYGPSGTVAAGWNVLSFQNGDAVTQLYFDKNTFALRKWKGHTGTLTEDEDHDPWYKAVLTGGSNNFEDGAVIFAGKSTDASAEVTQDAGNFFWDHTGKQLGLKTKTPAATLDVNGTAKVGVNGAVLTGILRATELSSGLIGTGTATISFTVAGAKVGGNVIINPRTTDFNAAFNIVSSRVSADNTVTIVFLNNTGSAVSNITFDLTVIQ